MAANPEVRRRVLAQVEARRGDIVNFLRDLISYRTESQNPANADYLPETEKCLTRIQQVLADMGCRIERWDASASAFSRHPVLAGHLPGSGGGRSVALNGHIDVVPVGDTSQWTVDPWAGELRNGKLYGRGACDMKGGVAAMVMALRALSDLGIQLSGDVWVHVVSDEEVVGWGSRECASRLPATDVVLDPEPTGLQVVPVEGGLEQFRIELDGRSTHAGQRWTYTAAGTQGDGASAVDKMLKIVGALQELERIWARRSYPLFPPGFNSLMPGIIIGGPGGGHDGQLNMLTNPGTTPNYCSVEYNLWFYPDQTFPEVRQEIEDYVQHVCQLDPWLREHPPRFTWHLRNVYFPPAGVDPKHPLVQSLAGALKELGRAGELAAFSAVCDIAWYGEQGVPGIVFGPGSLAQAHSPDEFVPVEEVIACAKAIALGLIDWLGCEG